MTKSLVAGNAAIPEEMVEDSAQNTKRHSRDEGDYEHNAKPAIEKIEQAKQLVTNASDDVKPPPKKLIAQEQRN